MKKTEIFGVFIVILLLTGCSPMSSSNRAFYQSVADYPIYCNNRDECEIKWGRAILWVSDHSHWKIRNQTDNLITTEGPFDTVFAAYKVNKIPLGGGKYQIQMDAWCGNPIGCVPETVALKADFVAFVTQENFDKFRLQAAMKYGEKSATTQGLAPTDNSEIKKISPKSIYVKYDSIEIYGRPGFDNKSISTASQSEQLTAIAENAGWYKVKLEDGKEGWVAKDWVEAVK